MLTYNRIKASHVFLLLLGFWVSWLYTEFKEAFERNDFYIEVQEFMHAGDRFTAADGATLRKRIEALERQLEQQK
jgi:hypothetical protein